ncbi:Gfo/Idh/MocA family protein [Mangrovimonas spongiae]|uniref:Gfo/Idh/MocA family oxidoreductase n=1 Tax=Mangrovimonas spongiae TaxID=2494697 RepID=A0A3R9MH54_9FLAO|nr:Gfo/Idh/MocA family oxidoreductase [Mangrovimonas spongiae]RSK40384.1 gfo/Idh/MocA family oxidoreductase [Mangrovimonas spongiae]
MTTNKTINWGIIGLGKIAHKFAEDLATINDANLYAVASRSQGKVNDFATLYQAEKAYNSYEALANDTTIDAVYIATPHVFHKENTIMCLKKGIAVLCEKPFAMNLEEVSEMIAIAKTNNTLLMEALWTAFLPHYQHVQSLLRKQHFGKLLKMEADFGFQPEYDENSRVIKKALGGGSLLDIGIYPIFAALSTLGKPQTIEASATFFDNGADASCNIMFKYQNNVIANLKSTLLEETETLATFYCEQGIIKINSRFHEPSTVTLLPKNGKEETLDFGYNTIGYSFETRHFNQLIREGKTQSNIMSFKFSKTLISTLDSVRQTINLNY